MVRVHTMNHNTDSAGGRWEPVEATTPNQPIGVLLVEDDASLLDVLASALERRAGLRIIGAFSSAEKAIAEAEWLRVEVAFTDLELPGINGVELITWIRNNHPHIRCAVHTIHDDRDLVFRAIAAGALGYVLKGAGPAEVSEQLRGLREGRAPLSPAIAMKLLETMGGHSHPAEEGRITERETELLRLFAEGHRYKEAAAIMGVSINTIQSHVGRIYGKLHANTRKEAVRAARLRGLI